MSENKDYSRLITFFILLIVFWIATIILACKLAEFDTKIEYLEKQKIKNE